MAKFCTTCNKKLPFGGGIMVYSTNEELCEDCYENHREKIKQEEEQKKIDEKNRLKEIIMISGYSIENKTIEKYFDIISKEFFAGSAFYTKLSTSFDDTSGMSSGIFAGSLEKAKEYTSDAIKHEAISLGANAIIGAVVQYTFTMDNILMYSICGTPVIIKDK